MEEEEKKKKNIPLLWCAFSPHRCRWVGVGEAPPAGADTLWHKKAQMISKDTKPRNTHLMIQILTVGLPHRWPVFVMIWGQKKMLNSCSNFFHHSAPKWRHSDSDICPNFVLIHQPDEAGLADFHNTSFNESNAFILTAFTSGLLWMTCCFHTSDD